MDNKSNRKAVALISGGLDSMLAVRVIQQQGILVEGLNFFTGFCVEGHTQAIRQNQSQQSKRNNALWVAEQLGIKLHFIDIVEPYKDVLLNPRYGYGKNLNPCLDCKIFMVQQALAWMKEQKFDFIITGEVIGQRPKSQRRDTMAIVARDSGASGLLVRPLCAKNLEPTYPEQAGWIDREHLFSFNGRSRKPQFALAKQFGFTDYAQPAGGCCFLTDAQYAAKLADLWESQGHKHYELDDIILLKIGRHLRPRPHFKLIIAREQGESQFLLGYRKQFASLQSLSHPGPFTLLDGKLKETDFDLAARIVARYTQGRDAEQVEFEVTDLSGNTRKQTVKPFQPHEILSDWYV